MDPLRFANWPIRAQVVAGPALSLALTVAIIAAVGTSFDRLQTTARQVASSLEAQDTAGNLLQHTVDMQSAVRGYVITGDDAFLTPYREARARIGPNAERLRTLLADAPDQLPRLDRILALIGEWQSSVAEPQIARVRAGEDAAALVRSGEGERRITVIRAAVQEFLEAEAARLTRRQQEDEQARRSATALLFLAFGAAVFAFAIAYTASGRMVTPLLALAAAARRIGEADLSVRVPVTGNNELGVTARAFNSMARALAEARAQMTAQHELLAQQAAMQERLRVRAETNEQRYRQLLNNAGDAIFVFAFTETGERTPFLEVNDTACNRYGYTREEFLQLSVADLLPHGWTEENEQSVATLRAEGHLMLERIHRTKAGDLIPTEVNIHTFPLEGRLAALVIARDITERKQAEDRLRRALADVEAQYRAADHARSESRAVLDAVSEAIVLLAGDRRILTVNHAFCEFFGFTPEMLIGHVFDEFAVDVERIFTDAPRVRALIAAGAEDRTQQFTASLTQLWPRLRELELFSTPVSGEDGRFLGRMFVLRDVTHQREVDRMKTEFVSLVSHELRTPLTSIKGYVDLLLEGEVGEVSDDQREFLTIVKNNADRLVALINDLLDISRIEAGRIELRRMALDLPRLVRGVGTMLGPQFEAKGQQLILDLPPALPSAWGDPDRVTQILTNLLSNAHKYTPAGGTVTVTAVQEGARLRVRVRDTGIGLSADEQQQLFTKFFRARNRTTQEVGGTGLGLAITRSLVELHGGEITVESAPGQGATFSFTLPLASGAPEAETVPAPLPPARRGAKVLVVDDEPDIAALVQRYLERGGYQVSVAQSGGEAFRKAVAEHPDLITLDVLLPDVDGFTVLEWLKGEPSTADIPVVLLSIVPDNGRAALLGAVDYLTKPVREHDLLERVSGILAYRQSRVVLVADDEPDVRALLVALLQRAGYQTVEASDGAEAVAQAVRAQPGLALVDIRMPELDGVAVLRALRNHPATRTIPVVMMTASPGLLDANRSAVEALGGAALLAKPTTVEELAAAVARAFRGASGGQA